MGLKNLLGKTYRGKKVFITGHTGFKGSWLTLWLESLGAIVKGYSLKPEKEISLYETLGKNLRCRSVFADIRDAAKLESELLGFAPDFIFHLAAQSLVRKSYRMPLYTFETNITGTANLLQSLTKLNKSASAVIVTTDKVYKNNEWIYPYRENDRLGGDDPYSASKACAELVVNSYVKSFFNPDNIKIHKKRISTARAGNVIGGGDYSEDRLFPDIARALFGSNTIIVRNPESIRPWQYVLEPLSGYLLLASLMSGKKITSGSYNFGPYPEDLLDVESVVKIAIECYGHGKYKVSKNKNAPHEAGTLRLDISKAIEIGWHPKMDTAEAIKKTMNWYKNSVKKNSVLYKLCLKDISEFESL